MVNALVCLGKFHGKAVNVPSAVSGLPVKDGLLTPQLFLRAAKRCGLEARIVRRSLKSISDAVLPAVLLTEDNGAAVLVSRPERRKNELVFCDTGAGGGAVSDKQLKDMYSGYAILVKPVYEFESRSTFTTTKRPQSWFWGTLFSFRSFYARVILATIIINLFALTSSIFVMNVYDRVVPNQAYETLWVLAIGALVAYSFEFILKSLRTFLVDRAGHRADLVMGSSLYEQILAMRYSSRPASAGALASQARAYESLREFFTSATIAALVDLPFVFLFAGVVFLLGGVTALPMVVGAVLAISVAILLQLPLSRAVEKSYQASTQRHALFVETLNALETVKASRAESALQSRMEECVQISAKAEGKSRWYSQLALNFTAFVQHMVSISIVIVAFFQILGENMTMGAMIACVILSGRGMAPLAMVASLLTRLQQSRRALQGLNEIMATPREREESKPKISVPDFQPSVGLSGVSFTYPESQGSYALRDLQLQIEPGERVAILGRIGSGKSTLLRLLMGFYELTEGRIDVSGIDLRQIEPSDLRRNIGYMPQDPMLLYGTLRHNLTIGSPWVEDDRIWASLDRAGLGDFVRSHPAGLDLNISEGGRSLSGGQRQAVYLARGLIEEPSLLVYDEPTAAMDYNSEQLLIQNLGEYLGENNERTGVTEGGCNYHT